VSSRPQQFEAGIEARKENEAQATPGAKKVICREQQGEKRHEHKVFRPVAHLRADGETRALRVIQKKKISTGGTAIRGAEHAGYVPARRVNGQKKSSTSLEENEARGEGANAGAQEADRSRKTESRPELNNDARDERGRIGVCDKKSKGAGLARHLAQTKDANQKVLKKTGGYDS